MRKTHNNAAPNTAGIVHSTRAQALAAFDRLPPPVRARLRESPFNFSAVQAMNKLLREGYTPKRLCKEIEATELDLIRDAVHELETGEYFADE